MNTLRAQHLRPRDTSDIERQLMEAFAALIFRPLLAVLEPENAQVRAAADELKNAKENALLLAIRSGRVQYDNGTFSGEFNKAITDAMRRIGATLDKRLKVYHLDAAAVPAWVKAEAGVYAAKARALHQEVLAKLDAAKGRLDADIDALAIDANKTVTSVEEGFRASSEGLAVMPEISTEAKIALEADYSKNMKLWIQRFTRDQIAELRVVVEKNATEGYRFDRLVHGIRERYRVSQSKAEFLARQETGLFMSKFRRERFKDAGVARYRWSTSHDRRVRHDHRLLDWKVFFYDQPPIVDPATGRRANPGEDFNCRCVDIPILDPIKIGQSVGREVPA